MEKQASVIAVISYEIMDIKFTDFLFYLINPRSQIH